MACKDPFDNPKRRLSRARAHISHLKKRIDKFFKKAPYTRVVEPDVDGVTQLHKIKLTEPIPDIITDLTYDAIDCLRSGLDQATYAVAVACHSKRPDLVHFPVADTPADFENLLNGRLKDFPADILTLFRGFKTYQGGNDPIWALNRIRWWNDDEVWHP
jgi:hypothetical protein